MESKRNDEICCPEFDPLLWNGKELRWDEKLFLKDRVRSILRVPLNFGSVMRRNMRLITEAGAASEELLVLSDENSLWGADVYIAVSKEVPGGAMVKLSGTFLCKVFEGSFSETGEWAKEMKQYVEVRGKTMRKLYFYYTTCPKCAEKYGKNYVALLAQV